MRLVPAKLHVPLVGGLDTKSDQKGVALTKLTRLENGEFTKRGSIRKRPGLESLSQFLDDSILAGTLSAPISSGRALGAFDDQLCLFSDDAVHTYTESADRWTRVTNLTPVSVASTPGPFVGQEQLAGESVVAGGYRFVAWEQGTGLVVSIYSADGGRVATSTFATSRAPRFIPLDGVVLLFYANSGSNDLIIRVFSLADPKAGLTTIATTVTDLNASNLYDATVEGNTALVIYHNASTNEQVVARVSSAGAVTATSTITGAVATLAATSITALPAGNRALLVYCTNATGTAAVVNTTSLSVTTTGVFVDEIGNNIITGVRTTSAYSSGNKVVGLLERSAVAASNHSVHWVELDLMTWPGGSTGNTQRIRRAHLASKGFYSGYSTGACWLGHDSTLQSTHFLYAFTGTTGELVGKLMSGRAGGILSRAHLSGVNNGETCLAMRRRLKLASTQTTASFFEHKGFEFATANFDHKPRSVDVGNTLYTVNGQLTAFDGTNAVESGFHLFPEGITTANQGAGNLTANGIYSYRVYYEWYTDSGERFRSLAIAVLHTVSGTAQIVRLTIPTLTHTRKPGVSIVAYRSESGPGAIHYRVSSNNPAATGNNGWINNSTTADAVVFDDNLADASILARETDYLSDDPQPLANTSPEAGSVILAAQNRLWVAGGGVGTTNVQFSKIRFDGEPVEFAGEFLLSIPEAGGPVVALGELNNAVIVFKRDRIYAIVGNGPDNAGAGNYLVEHITSDAGCTNPDTVVATPDGLMFLSAKGIYLLTQSLTVVYIGAEVEAFNGLNFTAARLIPDTNQVIFLASESPSLMYDYFYKQWSTWTSQFYGADAVTWADTEFTLLHSDGRVLVRLPDAFVDGGDPYYLRITTAPIRLREHILGFNKLRRTLVLGESRSPHDLNVGLIYDQDVGAFQTITIVPSDFLSSETFGGSGGLFGGGDLFGGPLAGAQYLFELRPKRTKFSTIRFDFQDVISGEAGAGYEISEILLDCYELTDAPKTGAARKF